MRNLVLRIPFSVWFIDQDIHLTFQIFTKSGSSMQKGAVDKYLQ